MNPGAASFRDDLRLAMIDKLGLKSRRITVMITWVGDNRHSSISFPLETQCSKKLSITMS